MAKKDDVIKTQPAGALALPSYLTQTSEGLEHLRRQDLRPSRILVAQQMSPQVNPNEPSFIEGLKVGDMFNDLSGKIYGKGPIDVVILRADPPRHIEFFPREAGGGIKDANVPEDDPRAQFTNDPVTGKRVPPVATKFYDYVVALLPLEPSMENYMALSFKGMGLRSAMRLNRQMHDRRPLAIFAVKYRLTSVQEKNSKGIYNVIYTKDMDPTVDPLTEQQHDVARFLSSKIRDKNLVIERQPGEDDVESLATDM